MRAPGALLWNAGAVALATLTGSGSRQLMQRRLWRVPLLSAITVLVGALSAAALLRQSGERTPGGLPPGEMIVTIGRAAEVLTLALSIAASGLLAWFHLYRRVVVLRLLRAELQRIIAGREEAI